MASSRSHASRRYALRDPREAEIAALVDRDTSAAEIVRRLLSLPGLFPAALAGSESFVEAVTHRLGLMLSEGMRTAIHLEAGQCRA